MMTTNQTRQFPASIEGSIYVIDTTRGQMFPAHGGTIRRIADFIFSGTMMRVLEATMEPGEASEPEYHDGVEIVYVLDGIGELEIAGQRYPFGAGDILHLPPEDGVPHRVCNTGTDTLKALLLFPGPTRSFGPSGEELALPPWMR
jgi:quercetin dioxygenase-like cupin family protein